MANTYGATAEGVDPVLDPPGALGSNQEREEITLPESWTVMSQLSSLNLCSHILLGTLSYAAAMYTLVQMTRSYHAQTLSV